MTEKRYDVIDKEEPRGQSVTYDGIPCTARTCVTRLNRLTEENEQLKMGINSLKLLVKNWEALDEEKDEQLDKQNQVLKKLKKENEQLKSEVKSLRIKHNDFSDPVDKKLLETVRRLFE